MNACPDIPDLLEQWLQLSKAEGSAIQSAAWIKLSELQSQKAALKKSLSEAELQWAKENPQAPASEKPFRAEIGRLLSMETRNRELLAVQLQRAQIAEQASIDQANRNLHKIQRSYAHKEPHVAWDSYS